MQVCKVVAHLVEGVGLVDVQILKHLRTAGDLLVEYFSTSHKLIGLLHKRFGLTIEANSHAAGFRLQRSYGFESLFFVGVLL